MRLTLAPGFVYLFTDTTHPNLCKIGSAQSMDAAEFITSVASPSLRLRFCPFFLDVNSALAHLHHALTLQHVGPGLYEVSYQDAAKVLEALVATCQAQRLQFTEMCHKIQDLGELALDDSQGIDAREGSAMARILAHVPNALDARDVRTLVPLALSTGPQSETAQRLLQSCGLIPHKLDSLVLLDRSEASLLDCVFEGTSCQSTWREQVAQFCGFNPRARAVGLGAWLDFTLAGSEVVDLVSPL